MVCFRMCIKQSDFHESSISSKNNSFRCLDREDLERRALCWSKPTLQNEHQEVSVQVHRPLRRERLRRRVLDPSWRRQGTSESCCEFPSSATHRCLCDHETLFRSALLITHSLYHVLFSQSFSSKDTHLLFTQTFARVAQRSIEEEAKRTERATQRSGGTDKSTAQSPLSARRVALKA